MRSLKRVMKKGEVCWADDCDRRVPYYSKRMLCNNCLALLRFRKVIVNDRFPQLTISERLYVSTPEIPNRNGCLEWTGSRDIEGYGRLSLNLKQYKAHRMTLIEAGFEEMEHALHSCDNPPCVNINHLSFGTAKENVLDAVTKGRHGRMTYAVH